MDFFYLLLKFPFNEKNHATFSRSNCIFPSLKISKHLTKKATEIKPPLTKKWRKFYDDLDKNFESISLEKGKDDNGEPIRVVIDNSKKQNIPVILINNGIHPG
ncbi:MAG: hypothetical protein U0T85_08065 [Cloacibacterium normanense]